MELPGKIEIITGKTKENNHIKATSLYNSMPCPDFLHLLPIKR